MAKIKWTPDIRNILYTELVERFGPYNKWKKIKSPGTDKKAEYEEFKAKFAEMVTFLSNDETTAEAVQLQIDWAITKQPKIEKSGHVYNYILNISSAINCGFLASRDLPEILLAERDIIMENNRS